MPQRQAILTASDEYQLTAALLTNRKQRARQGRFVVQSVKAIVAVREGTSVTPDELIEHCRARIASYKKPRTVEFVDSLPRKGFAIDYDALDDRFGGGGYPGGWNRSV